MAKKKVAVVENEDEVQEKEAPPRKAKKVAKPGSGVRPLSVGGIIDKGTTKQRNWEKTAPWNRKDPRPSRFSRSEIQKHASNRRA